MPEEIETLKSAPKILVYDDDGVKGFLHLIQNGNHCYIEMGVFSNEQIKSIGFELWQAASEFFDENTITSVQVFHVKDNEIWKELFEKLNFEYWYSVYRLDYRGPKLPEHDRLEMTKL